MAESIVLAKGNKQDQYESLLPQLEALTAAETDLVANMANCTAALKMQFNWLWVGFYLVKGTELVLGPFQGPVACTRIAKGRGVCGTAWAQATTITVPNVALFPGHIACSSLSQSEIVIPIFNHEQVVIGVLDIDSEALNSFDKTDAYYLEKIVKLLQC